MKEKAPSSKLQAPEKYQDPKTKVAGFGAWCLELFWSLELGAWSFYRPS
jgi:hypothetical protein